MDISFTVIEKDVFMGLYFRRCVFIPYILPLLIEIDFQSFWMSDLNVWEKVKCERSTIKSMTELKEGLNVMKNGCQYKLPIKAIRQVKYVSPNSALFMLSIIFVEDK